jgi:hypothetical protein
MTSCLISWLMLCKVTRVTLRVCTIFHCCWWPSQCWFSIQTPGSAGPDAVPAVLYVGMMRVHMTFVTTVGLPLDSVTPPQSIIFLLRAFVFVQQAARFSY